MSANGRLSRLTREINPSADMMVINEPENKIMNGSDINTPLMKQYNSFKSKYPDAILLFRIGDFYETFGEDAKKTSQTLGIVLTKRANGAAAYVDLAGFPHHALDTYLPKLVKAGYRVAICDQLEDPKLAKKIVKRGVTELVTPGVSYNDKILEQKENNFLAAVHFENKRQDAGAGVAPLAGAAFLDVSTGEFYLAEGSTDYIDKLLQGLKPSEVIFQRNMEKEFTEIFGDNYYHYTFEDWIFSHEFAYELLTRHFQTANLKGFGIENFRCGIIAAGAALHYLAVTQHDKVKHISSISRIDEGNYVWLDRFTIRNLELINSIHENGGTLLEVLDHTATPMGSRMLRRWMTLPLKEKQLIEERLSIVDHFIKNETDSGILHANLLQIGDLERLISKAATARINPREMNQLKRALTCIEPIRKFSANSKNPFLIKISDQLNPCDFLRGLITKTIQPDPPAQFNKGNIIANGFSEELDELRKIAYSGKDYLIQIQQREIQNTGITSLKVGFNTVFGYYIEVTNAHKNKVPSVWIRKQTLVNAERYITEELKEYEEKILGAEEKINALELRLFNELVIQAGEFIASIQLNASILSRLDCLLSFAGSAKKYRYSIPEINDSKVIDIKEGRHPVIEAKLPPGESYIPNDVFLDNDTQQIIILTGPNMSGKSALLRQTALIVLMAQMGSFVPAREARIGMVDKIFTRVGASDSISTGESTFMVEMTETSSILNNLSDRSLIILDEIGRGTSTYDGISIAWAIAEFLHGQNTRPKTLFATHYHELNEMAEDFNRIKNFHIAVKEVGNKVLFLRKMAQGGTEHSFGIHVAKMSGMPQAVIERANEVLEDLEEAHGKDGMFGKKSQKKQEDERRKSNSQLNIFSANDAKMAQLVAGIEKLDLDTLTPVEALLKLSELKKIIK